MSRRSRHSHFAPEARAFGRALSTLAILTLRLIGALVRLLCWALGAIAERLEKGIPCLPPRSAATPRSSSPSRNARSSPSSRAAPSSGAAGSTSSAASARASSGSTSRSSAASTSARRAPTEPPASLQAARLVAGLAGMGFRKGDAHAFAAGLGARVDAEPLAELLREGIAACAARKVG